MKEARGYAPWRRWVRRIVWGLLGLLTLAVLLVAGALTWLTAPAGERWLRGNVLERVNEQLSGRLEAGEVDVSLSGLTLRDVKLYTPEGELVAEVALIDARLSLAPLARQEVELSSVRVERPRLYLEQDERGLNLARALEPRQPRPEEPDPGRGSLRLSVRDFLLEDGYVDFQADTDEGTRHVRLEDLDATGSGSYGAAEQRFRVSLEATGGLALPITGPVELSLRSQGEEENLSADVELSVAGLETVARGGMRGPDEAWVELRRLSLPPETARALVPGWPLLVPVSVEGTARKQGDVLQAELDARAGSAAVDVDGSLNLATLRSEGLTLKARDVNLAELVENGPPTSLGANLTARGGGTRLETLDGEVALTVSPSSFKGQPLGPVELRASAKDGHYQLSRLRVVAPGASLEAQGQGTVDDLQVRGHLSASNLAVLGQTVGRLGPGPALPLSGSGALDFQVKGPLRAPGVELSGAFASLGYEDTVLQALELKASLPDVTRPLSGDASVTVGELRTGERTFQNLAASVTTRDRALEARVRSTGELALDLALAGTVDEDQDGLTVSALTLAYPEATWRLQGSTHMDFDFGEGRLEVRPALTLTSEGQRLALTLEKAGPRVDGRLEVGALELRKLPRAFVPESLGLGGTLSGQVSVQGRLPRPDARLALTLEDGSFQQYSELDLGLRGTYERDRATGTLTANAPAASLTASFDVPVQGLLRRRSDALSLEVNLSRLSLEEARKVLGIPEPVSGTLTGQLEVVGTAREPRLALTLRGEGIRHDGKPLGILRDSLSFTLRASSDAKDGTLDARLEAQGLGSEAYVALETPFTLGQLMAEPPTADALVRAPVSLEARVEELPFSLLAGAARLQEAQGQVSLRLGLSGSVLVPEGKLELAARGVTANGLPPMDGRLTVVGGGEDLRVELSALQREGERSTPLVDLRATLDAPLGAVQDPDVIGWVPFELHGRIHPTPLRELPGLARAEPALREQGLQGTLALELIARGTPARPQVVLNASLQQLGVGRLALGQAHLYYAYADARSRLDTLVTAPAGGTLHVEAGLPLELSLPAVQQGLEVDRLPLDMTVKARRFDMGFLSGAHERVRSLGGVLEADARIAGTLGAPTLQGTVGWKDGRLGLMGFGEYRDIRLELAVTEERIRVQELFARAGAGELRLTADARRSRGAYELTGQTQLRDFPLITDDQLVAVASLKATMEGSLTSDTVNIRNLAISQAQIELPEVQRKDLQPLERPADVVLVRDGVPLEKRRRKRAEPARSAQAQASPPKGAPAGEGGLGGAGGTPAPPAPAEPQPAEPEEEVQRTYRVLVNAPRNIWVRGSDVNLELGLSPDFELSYTDEPYLAGEVFVLRGRVEVLGRRFDVQRDSRIVFTGPPLSPYLNITAEHQNEREDVTVYVHIRGQGKDFTIEPTSEPPMSETEIYTLLATGRSTLERNSGASMTGAQAASVVGSLVASQAKKALAAELPLDVFSIEAGEGGLEGTRFEVGKYLTDKIYIGYTGRPGAIAQERENNNAVRLEYQFSPQWSLEANYGDARSGGLDLIWGKDY